MLKQILFYIMGLVSCGLILLLASCNPGPPPVTQFPTPTVSATAAPPIQTEAENSPTITPTSVPLAAQVNGYEISLSEFEAELKMFQSAKGTDIAPEDQETVLNDLIDQALLAGAAAEKGYDVSEDLLAQRIQQLTEKLGSEQALESWYKSYDFDLQTFHQTLKRSIAAAWMRDQIAAEVPASTEQVHARQILLYNADQANEVFQLLQSGNSFRNLALQYDPITGGDLGWFPRGYLPYREIEEAAFSLELEAYSPVIETASGFHIIQVLEREADRPISPDALLVLQQQAVANWLEQARASAQIEVFLP